MPARAEEIKHAKEEGVDFLPAGRPSFGLWATGMNVNNS
jgi:hypothetical protein